MPQIPLPDPALSDGVVSLRPFTEADVPVITAACRDPEIPRWTAIPSPYTELDAREYVSRAPRDRIAGRELSLAVVDANDGHLIGSVGLARFSWDDRKAEIGYWIAPQARQRSAGTRATRLLSSWALERLELERIELLANPANEASQRLALAAGFKREGLLRAYRARKGELEDYVMFSLLRSDLDGAAPRFGAG
jgi:RimJ/RimL family protein N-acetyltransferase